LISKERTYLIISGCIGLVALVLQLILILSSSPNETAFDVFKDFVYFISFMTIMSNTLVTAYFFIKAIRPGNFQGNKGSSIEAALFVYIAVVLIVYHAVLARLWDPQGWQWLADFLLHSLIPILYFIYWFIYSGKNKIPVYHILYWLIFPLLYLVYSMLRGALTSLYPYPFLDLSIQPLSLVIRNCVFITIGYCILSVIIISLNNRLNLTARRRAANN